MKNKNHIPKDTNDTMSIVHLKRLPFESVSEDVSELLEWLQDGHWTVAEGIAAYLAPYVNEIKQELLYILNTDDGMWKYCVIISLIAKSPCKLDPSLIEALDRIAKHPTNIDAEEGVDDVAKVILKNTHLA